MSIEWYQQLLKYLFGGLIFLIPTIQDIKTRTKVRPYENNKLKNLPFELYSKNLDKQSSNVGMVIITFCSVRYSAN